VEKKYYRPTDRGKEAVFAAYLAKLEKVREEAAGKPEARSQKPEDKRGDGDLKRKQRRSAPADEGRGA
jgi:hypothetical protein